VLLGLSAFQYYEQREVTWHKDPAAAVNDIILRVRSLWRSDEQAPFVIERSQPSDQVRPIRELTGQDSIAADIDPRYIDPGEPRFETSLLSGCMESMRRSTISPMARMPPGRWPENCNGAPC
jgi:hypothetical protein